MLNKMLNKCENKETQTDYYQSFDKLSETTNHLLDNIMKNHLEFAGQTYIEHLLDSMSYCGKTIKASFFFFVHAFVPDCFTQSGSHCVHELSNLIKEKYDKRIDKIYESINQK